MGPRQLRDQSEQRDVVRPAEREESEMMVVFRVSTDAYGRYQAGFSLPDALDAALCGRNVSDLLRGLIESRVLAKICSAASDNPSTLHTTLPAIEALGRSDAAVMPVIQRARAGGLLRNEAAVLAIAAHHDPLWTMIEGIARAGFSVMIQQIAPSNGADPAGRQNRLAKQIASVSLDDRLVALVNTISGMLCRDDLLALAAVTRSKEIWEALAQVRMVVTSTRLGDD